MFHFVLMAAAIAVGQNVSPYVADPYDVPSRTIGRATVGETPLWQIDPWGVGYDLVRGFRPVYSGVRQPIGHEIIPTRPDGNGYVYRPVYAPSRGYHYTPGGALVVEFPQQHPTRPDAPFPAVAAPTEHVEPLPVPAPPRRGPREF
jgi:hypothetical protein